MRHSFLIRTYVSFRMIHHRNVTFSFLPLTGTSWDLNNAPVKQEQTGGLSDDGTSCRVSHTSVSLT